MEYVICYYDEYKNIKRYIQMKFDSEKIAQEEINYQTNKNGINETNKLFITTYDNFLKNY
jgi:hypothetical protein